MFLNYSITIFVNNVLSIVCNEIIICIDEFHTYSYMPFFDCIFFTVMYVEESNRLL